jgi:hypothetical protein
MTLQTRFRLLAFTASILLISALAVFLRMAGFNLAVSNPLFTRALAQSKQSFNARTTAPHR